MQKSVLVTGELNPDLVLQGYQSFPALGKEVLVEDFVSTLGSASAICAAGLAKLGTPVSFIGKVGADLWGDFSRDALAAEGVDVSLLIRDPAVKTGVTVSVTSHSDRALITYPGAIVALVGTDVSDEVLRRFNHLHMSSYFLQEGMRRTCRDLFARARTHGLTVSLDPGFDPSERWERDLIDTLREVDLFFPNEVELAGITGETDPERALNMLTNKRTRTIAKLGRSGCATLDKGRFVHVPAFQVEPVDTTGAGDSFDAGFLHAWLQDRPLMECLRWGAACGALSTRASGGTPGQPTAADVEEFLRTRP